MINNKTFLIVLLLFGIIILQPTINAEISSLPTGTRGECIGIEQTCSNCTTVTIDSIKYPNNTRQYLGTTMTNNGGNGYTTEFCSTNQTGKYIVTTCGDVDGENTCVDYDFEITRLGKSEESNINVLYFITWILGYIFITLILIKGTKIPLFNFMGYLGILINSIVGILIIDEVIGWAFTSVSVIWVIERTYRFMHTDWKD